MSEVREGEFRGGLIGLKRWSGESVQHNTATVYIQQASGWPLWPTNTTNTRKTSDSFVLVAREYSDLEFSRHKRLTASTLHWVSLYEQ